MIASSPARPLAGIASTWPAALVRFAPWLALSAYALLMLLGTHLPYRSLPSLAVVAVSDKLLHFSAYFGLTALVVLAAIRRPQPGRGVALPPWRIRLAAAAGLALLALVDEATQPLTGRCCDPLDWLANVGGIATAIVMAGPLLRLVGSWPLLAWIVRDAARSQ